ncbi:hypothetical protein WN943_003768 [Citrus x changshan-huyou]
MVSFSLSPSLPPSLCEATVNVHGVLPSSPWCSRIFTEISMSPASCRRQWGSHYTIRAP